MIGSFPTDEESAFSYNTSNKPNNHQHNLNFQRRVLILSSLVSLDANQLQAPLLLFPWKRWMPTNSKPLYYSFLGSHIQDGLTQLCIFLQFFTDALSSVAVSQIFSDQRCVISVYLVTGVIHPSKHCLFEEFR